MRAKADIKRHEEDPFLSKKKDLWHCGHFQYWKVISDQIKKPLVCNFCNSDDILHNDVTQKQQNVWYNLFQEK